MARKLFWAQLERPQVAFPQFVRDRGKREFAWRFKRAVNVVDYTAIQPIASCMSWPSTGAARRRRKDCRFEVVVSS